MKFRHMTAIYIQAEDRLLMLYRVGSRVVAPSWCGIGGHFEKDELNDPQACVLRELREETGLLEGDLTDLRLRYVALRKAGDEVRQNHYFFARLAPGSALPAHCSEGELKPVPLGELMALEMPVTAKAVLGHWLAEGRYDRHLYAAVMAGDGQPHFAALDG